MAGGCACHPCIPTGGIRCHPPSQTLPRFLLFSSPPEPTEGEQRKSCRHFARGGGRARGGSSKEAQRESPELPGGRPGQVAWNLWDLYPYALNALLRMQMRCYSRQVRTAPSMATQQSGPTLIVDTRALRSGCREGPQRGASS